MTTTPNVSELVQVRAHLRSLDELRTMMPLTTYQLDRWDALIERERELLAAGCL